MVSIVKRIGDATKILQTVGYKAASISAREFRDYLTGETLTGDTFTVSQILASDYFMIHEVAEMSELKARGIPLTKKTILEHTFETDEAHLVASEQEFTYATRIGDYSWLIFRLRQAVCWLDDPHLPTKLRPLYESLVERYKQYVESR
jgi:hypothetical protein